MGTPPTRLGGGAPAYNSPDTAQKCDLLRPWGHEGIRMAFRMAGHRGARRDARRKLNRSILCKGDAGGYLSFYFTGQEALDRATRSLRAQASRLDKRTSPWKQAVAATHRLEILGRELGR